jgi:undecaprenyl-diphosphatase
MVVANMHKFKMIINLGDIKLFYMVNDRIKCTILDKTMPIITHLGGAISTITTCLLLIIYGKGIVVKAAGYQCLTTLTASFIVSYFLKKKFTRPRPFLKLLNVNTFNFKLKDYSFPSGHTTAAFAVYLTLSLIFTNLAAILIPIATIVGISRVYIGVHYPSDVIIGGLIGSTFSLINYFWLSDTIMKFLV